MDPTMIFCDNQSSIRLTEYLMFHVRTKHINNNYHDIILLVQDGVIKLRYISKYEHVVNIMTKSLPNKKLKYLRSKLGLVNISYLIMRER